MPGRGRDRTGSGAEVENLSLCSHCRSSGSVVLSRGVVSFDANENSFVDQYLSEPMEISEELGEELTQ
jgi:hypothetical protein